MSPTNYRHEIVGVFGDPVDENPTIAMHEAAFKAKGLHWRYQNFRVKPDGLAAAMQGMRAMNFKGINLTIPHKVAVIQHLDRITPEAVRLALPFAEERSVPPRLGRRGEYGGATGR